MLPLLPASSYAAEDGVSQAVIDAAFALAIKLQQGAYDRPPVAERGQASPEGTA